jgi:hypothetical protein
MLKRKVLLKELCFWNKDGRYIVPYGHSSFKELKNDTPDIKVIFIKHCTPMSICKELFNPRKFEHETSDYYIIDEEEITPEMCSKIQKFKINIRGKEIFWNGINFIHRNTIICEKCFILGILIPKKGCILHIVKCNHSREILNNSCNYCFARSFASYWEDSVSQICSKENFQVICKYSSKKYDFNCRKCQHVFNASLNNISNDKGCPYCANRKLCGKIDCHVCFEKSFASFDIVKRQCIQTKENLYLVFKSSGKKYDFKCYTCYHLFLASLHLVSKGRWCPYCANKKLCGKENCKTCFDKSFASVDIEKRNCIQTSESLFLIFKRSHNKYDFNCTKCFHTFPSSPDDIFQNYWCPYCASKKLCGADNCKFCFEKSFASFDLKKRNCIQTSENLLFIFKHSSNKYPFKCFECSHLFIISPSDIGQGNWCGYCSNPPKLLCGSETCKICFEKSFASFDVKKRDCIQTSENLLLLFKHSNFKHDFRCFDCGHLFLISLSNVCQGRWCRYCRGYVCGKETCLLCEKQCYMAKCPKKARKQTKVTKTWYCEEHFKDCIARNPEETPLIYRAKISLEIYTFAELQRISMFDVDDYYGLYWSNPTNWDCRIIPGLTYKPDNIFCFDTNFDIIPYADDLILNLNKIGYVMIVEVLEEGKKQHSLARSISDEERERKMRNLLDIYNIPMGCLYVSMAHSKHFTAHPDDVFFHKVSNGEYEVIPNRMTAFQNRIKEMRDMLTFIFENKLNETKWIGH